MLSIQPGPWYIAHAWTFYIYLLAGMYLLWNTYRNAGGILKKQATVIMLAALIPWFVNVLYLLDIRPLGHLDLTPYAFVASNLFIGLGLIRYQLFEIIPFAREKLIEKMRNGAIVLDENKRVVDINPSMLELLQARRTEIIGQSFTSIFSRQINLNSLIASEDEQETEIIIKVNGLKHHLEVTITSLRSSKEKSNGLLLIFTDITRQKNLEQEAQVTKNKLKAILESTHEIIFLFSPDFEILSFNKAANDFALRLTGNPLTLDVRLGYDLVNEKDLNEFIQDFNKVLKGETILKEQAQSYPDGTHDWMESRMFPAHDDKGKLVGVILILMNINYRKESELALKHAKISAERANKSKSEFLANMSHEIRTPMNAILGFTEILNESETDPQKKEQLEIISKNGKSLLSLINDILDLSKIEAGYLKLNLEEGNIVKIAEESIATLRPMAEGKGLTVELSCQNNLPPLLILDELRLKQVLINLLQNAIKFTPSGFVKLALGFEWDSDAKEGSLLIEVEDTGIGIEKEDQEIIFDYFQQSQTRASKAAGGTGLGLAITRKIVQMAGGSITISSELGKGSIFRIRFPHVRLPENQWEELKAIPSKDEQPLHGVVLAVDDVEINLALLRQYLKNYPIKIHTTTNGMEALELARKFKPDVILMDLRMPDLSGQETTNLLKQDPITCNIPVIAFTASVFDEEHARLGENFSGYLAKPIQKAGLLDAIRPYLA
jgi:PAS domain S-box-containing protein